jgi:drug/metabolite transporter (DMT)-like permease
MAQPQNPQLYGLGLAFFGIVVLSPDALLVRLVSTDHWSLVFGRGAFTLITFIVILAFRYRRQLLSRFGAMDRIEVLASFLFAFSSICFVSSVSLTLAANTLFMLAGIPLLAVILEWSILKVRPTYGLMVAILVLMFGIGIIVSGSVGKGNIWGDFLAFGTAFATALVFVIFRGRGENFDNLPSISLGALLTTLIGLALALFSQGEVKFTPDDLVYLAIMGLVVQGVAISMITAAPRYVSAGEVGLIMLVEAVLGPLWVWAFIGEVPPFTTYIGGALVLLGVFYHGLTSLARSRYLH